MSYPTSVSSFSTKSAGQVIQPAHINDLQTEVVAIEQGLLNGVAHNIIPLTDATYDIGSVSHRFRDLTLSRAATIGATAAIGGKMVVAGTTVMTGAVTMQSTVDVTGDAILRGKLGVGSTATTQLQVFTSTGNGFKFTESGTPGGYFGTFTVDANGVKIDSGSGVRDLELQIGGSTKLTVATDGAVKLNSTSGTFTERNRSFPMGATQDQVYASGDFTASGGASWNTTSGNIKTNSYRLTGDTLWWTLDVQSTTITAASPLSLSVKIPGGFTNQQAFGAVACKVFQSATTATNAYVVGAVGGTSVSIFRDDGAGWGTSSGPGVALTLQLHMKVA